MGKYQEIDKFNRTGSSAICLDIRNSTRLMRQFNKQQLRIHAKFLNEIKELVFVDGKVGDFSISDSGDGMMCLFWNKEHSWTAFGISIAIYHLVTDHIKHEYDKFLLKSGIDEKFRFGMGVHCGGSIIFRNKSLKRDFMYGNVLNTTTKLESFTKTFTNIHILFSGHFVDTLEAQLPEFNKFRRKDSQVSKKDVRRYLRKITDDKVFIGDSKREGHMLWTVDKSYLDFLKE